MNFTVRSVFINKQGEQIAFDVENESKFAIVNLEQLTNYFKMGTCKNAVLIDNCYVIGTSEPLHFSTIDENFFPNLGNAAVSADSENNDFTDENLAIYRGTVLKNLIHSNKVARLESRNIVKGMVNYAKNRRINDVVGILGLKGSGKTTVLLQAIYLFHKNLGVPYDNMIYLHIKTECSSTCNELYNLIMSEEFENVDFIFVDDITRLSEFVVTSSILYNGIAFPTHKKLFVSGSALSLNLSSLQGLYKRVLPHSIAFMTYPEASRLMGTNFDEYIANGGLYEHNRFNDLAGLESYIQTVATDIVKTVERNKILPASFNILKDIDISNISRMVFNILHSVMLSRITNEFNQNDIMNKVHQVVIEALEKMDVLVKFRNVFNSTNNYFIKNPCISKVLCREITDISENVDLISKQIVFSDIIAMHLQRYCNIRGFDFYAYHDDKNRTIDFVVHKDYSYEFEVDEEYWLFEVKLTPDVDLAVLNSVLVNDNDILDFFETYTNIVERAIIYTGKTMALENPSKTQKRGVLLISAAEFLSDIARFLNDK